MKIVLPSQETLKGSSTQLSLDRALRTDVSGDIWGCEMFLKKKS